nr:hypothetical protein [Mycoplasmopsis bovis]
MTLGEVFDNLVKKVNREDSKITIEESSKKILHYNIIKKVLISITGH